MCTPTLFGHFQLIYAAEMSLVGVHEVIPRHIISGSCFSAPDGYRMMYERPGAQPEVYAVCHHSREELDRWMRSLSFGVAPDTLSVRPRVRCVGMRANSSRRFEQVNRFLRDRLYNRSSFAP